MPIYNIYGKNFSINSGFEFLPKSKNSSIDFHIEENNFDLISENLIQKLLNPDLSTFAEVYFYNSFYYICIGNSLRVRYSQNSGQIDYISSLEEREFKHLILDHIIPLVLSVNRLLVIHASVVAKKDSIYAFMARSGTGKSTIAKYCMEQGFNLISDDSLVISAENNLEIFPGYPNLRLFSSTTKNTKDSVFQVSFLGDLKGVSLKKIFILDRSNVDLSEFSKVSALKEIVSNLILMDPNKFKDIYYFNAINKLVEEVSVFKLGTKNYNYKENKEFELLFS